MITEELSKRLREYYNGKLCSVITQPFALSSVDAKAFHTWFTVRIDDIDREAILGTDLNRGTKHVFFFGPALIGIAEEQVVAPDHPQYDKLRKQIEGTNQAAQEQIRNQSMPTNPQSTFKQLPILPVSKEQSSAIDKISRQAADLKKKWAVSASQGIKSDEQQTNI